MPKEFGPKSQKQSKLRVIVMNQIPKDREGHCAVDIFVRLPSADKYVCWVKRGDIFPDAKREKLLNHPDPRIYCSVEDWQSRHKFMDLPEAIGNKIGEESKEFVADLFTNLLDDDGDHEKVSTELAEISNTIVTEILKDLENYEREILQEVEDISRLEDSYAIRSLCILFAMACGFDSKTAFSDITSATLFMDVGLLDFTQEEINEYYKDRSKMSPTFIKAFEKHPVKAHFEAMKKLKKFSEQSLLMILNHHELHNGRGYPRKSQTRMLPNLVRVLAYAVDVFETLKRAELRGAPKGLKEVLFEIYEYDVEPHQRRHQTELMDKVIKYLEIEDKKGKKAV